MKRKKIPRFISLLILSTSLAGIISASTTSLVTLSGGSLSYGTYANQGQVNSVNKIPDFSYCGYQGGGVALPSYASIPVQATVYPGAGDRRADIQTAINTVSGLTPDGNGFRGAVLIKAGLYEVSGPLTITASGVVLRGEGQSGLSGSTIIVDTLGVQNDLIQIGSVNATTRVEAESFSSQSGITTASGGTGTVITSIHNGDYIKFTNFDFKAGGKIRLAVATYGETDGVIKFRLPNPTAPFQTGPVICAVPVEDTADDHPADDDGTVYFIERDLLAFVSTPQDLYITFEKPNGGVLGNIDYIEFSYPYALTAGSVKAITDTYIPSGTKIITLANTTGYSVNDKIVVMRTPNDAWVNAIGMDWQSWRYNVGYECKVTAISGNQITIDCPLVTPIESQYGGGYVFRYTTPTRINKVGVENIFFDSSFTSSTDEAHGWRCITMSNVEDSWVRDVTAVHFGFSTVTLDESCRQNTIQDCAYRSGISIIKGGRRYPFGLNTTSSRNLFLRCYTAAGRHNFYTAGATPGPNAFVDCYVADHIFEDTGPHNNWATGTLYDNISADWLAIANYNGSHGYAGAQNIFWNSVARVSLTVQSPVGARNFAFGCITADQVGGNGTQDYGYYEDTNATAELPRSLYFQQLKDRLGQGAVDNVAFKTQQNNLSFFQDLASWAGRGQLTDTLLNEDFDLNATNSAPAGWSANTAGGTVTVVETPNAEDKSCKLNDTSTSNICSASYAFASQTGLVECSFSFMTTDSSKLAYFKLGNTDDTAVRLRISGGFLQYEHDSTDTTLQAVSSNIWYDVKVVADIGTGLYDVYVDDELRLQAQPFNASVADFARFLVQTHSSQTNTLYFDKVKVIKLYAGQSVDDDFDLETIGNAPTNWSLTTTGGTVTIQDAPGSGTGNCIKLVDTNGSNLADATKAFTSTNTDTVLRFFMYAAQTNQVAAVNLSDSADMAAVTVIMDSTGFITTYHGGTKTNVQAYSVNTWYEFKVVARPYTDKFDLYVNGVKMVNDQPLRNAVSGLSKVRFNSTGASTGTWYLDEVEVR